MRRLATAALCTVAVITTAGLYFARPGPADQPDAEPSSTRASPAHHDAYDRSPFDLFAGALRGRVVNGDGPVADASVLLIDHRAAGTIGSEPCPCDPEWGPYDGLLDEFCECREADRLLADMLTALVGESPVIAGDTTDEDGGFEIPTPPPGIYVLFAEHPTAGAGLVSDLAADEEEEIEITLLPAAEFTGEVVDDFEEPLADARIVALHIATGRAMETTSDEAGAFCFSGVHDGEYYVMADKEAFFPSVELRFEDEDWLGIWLTSPRQIAGLVKTPRGGPAASVAITLRGFEDRHDTVSGSDGRFGFSEIEAGEYYVVAESRDLLAGKLITVEPGEDRQRVLLELEWVTGSDLVGVVTDDSGDPIAGARVRVEGDETWGTDTVFTDAEGRYHVRPLAPGEYDLTADAPGHGQLCGWVEIDPDQTTELDLSLSRGGIVRGVVQTADGEPVADAFVSLETTEDWETAEEDDFDVFDDGDYDDSEDDLDTPEAFIDGEFCIMLEAVTAADGSFTLDGVTAGEYELTVEHDGPSLYTETFRLPNRDLQITLPTEGVLEGQVVDAHGAAVPFASLTLHPEDGISRGYDADENGDFEIDGISDGAYQLLAAPRDGPQIKRRAEARLEVDGPGSLAPLLLELEPGYQLSGRVLDPDGYLVEAASVWLHRDDGTEHRLLSDDGSFAVDQLPAGAYRVAAAVPAFGSRGQRVVIAGGDAEVTLQLDGDGAGDTFGFTGHRYLANFGAPPSQIRGLGLRIGNPARGPLDSVSFSFEDLGLEAEDSPEMAEALAALELAAEQFRREETSWHEEGLDEPFDDEDEELEEGWDDVDLWGEDADFSGFDEF